jgi:hypothetical protein
VLNFQPAQCLILASRYAAAISDAALFGFPNEELVESTFSKRHLNSATIELHQQAVRISEQALATGCLPRSCETMGESYSLFHSCRMVRESKLRADAGVSEDYERCLEPANEEFTFISEQIDAPTARISAWHICGVVMSDGVSRGLGTVMIASCCIGISGREAKRI